MRADRYPKPHLVAACLVPIAIAFVTFFAQNRQPSPDTTPSPSPTASATPTPVRVPSPTPLPGAQNFHQWGSITVFNGLPSDSVRAIAQTRDGVMWFGTDNGLARFDGRRIQNFSPGHSDASKSILAFEYDEKAGALFIGTRAGAFVYMQDQFEPITGTETYAVTSILLWDRLYLGTDAGLVLRQTTSDKSAQSPLEPMFPNPMQTSDGTPAPITSLVTNGEYLVAGTAGRGVLVIREGGPVPFHGAPNSPLANALLRDRHDAIWIGTDAARNLSGLYEIGSGRAGVRIAAPTSKVLSLEENDNGVWAGSERFGLFHITDSKLKKNYTFENTSGGLRSNNINTLFTDREGVLWIGTNRGVSRFDQTGALQETVSDIPNSNFIRTLHLAPVEGEHIYAGSNRGLFLQGPDDKWVEVPGLRNKCVYAIQDRNALSLLIGTSDGLYSPAGGKLMDGDVRSLDRFNNRDYAAVFGRGLFDVTSDRPQLVYSDARLTSVSKGTNRLWIGTLDNGLLSFDGRNARVELTPDVLKSGTIWKINETDENGDVWIAGEHGVFLVRNGTVEQISAVEDVRDIWPLPNEFWAATTTRGLIHGRFNERFGWMTSSIGFEQGLPSEKAFSILPVEGGFVIATNRGIVTYAPREIAPKLIPIRLLSQRVHDVPELQGKIDLEYPQNSLLIEVAGQSSRTFPEEFQYAFVLKNSKNEEVQRQLSNEPQYPPSDLSPGDYTIEAIAFNRDLLPSEPLNVRFSVAKAPFPWTATALGVLLAIAVVALIWAVVERRRIVLRNRELAAARLDLAHEAERERSRIARDLHDQTLADLRDLIMKSDRELPSGSGFREDIESISTEIRRICEDLSPSVLENVGFIASLEFLLSHTIENYKFRAGETTDDEIKFPVNVQLQVYRIVQEVLTNIKRHADAKLVEMTVAVPAPGSFELEIANDGKPFTPPQNSFRGGRGIAGIRSRASLIHATVEWDQPNGHPRFRLSLDSKS